MKKHLIFKIVTIWFLITQSFPPYDYFVHMMGVIPLGLFVLSTFVLFPSFLSKKTVIALFLYTLAVYFVFLRGNEYYDSIARVIVPSLEMLSALLITEYAFKYDTKFRYTKTVLVTVLITNLIMIGISIPQLLINPNIIRGASTFGAEEGETMVYYWIISYATIHGLPCLIAPLVLLCRKSYHNNKKLIVYSFVTLALVFIIFKSNATTALLITLMMLFLGLFFNIKKMTPKNCLKILGLLLAFGLVLSPTVMVSILDSAQGYLDPQGSNYKKLDNIKDSYTYGDSDGDLGAREALYNQSKSLFFSEPLTGTSHSNLISMHTWFWDQLACMGFVLFSTFVLMFWYHVRMVNRSLSSTRAMYLWGIGAMLSMLYLKNSFGSGTWLYGFAILPVLCRFVDYEIKAK